MFGKKCSLCGGKLDSRKICTECGLDNNKSERNYHVNQSSCDSLPLSHVHREESSGKGSGKGSENRSKNRSTPLMPQYGRSVRGMNIGGKNDTSGAHRGLALKFLTGLIVMVIIACAGLWKYEEESGKLFEDHDWTEEYDAYQFVERELPEDGEKVEYELESGSYVVGVHIPEGAYVMQTQNPYEAVEVTDDENGIYLYEYAEEEQETFEDIRLYQGAVLTIRCAGKVEAVSENAQVEAMQWLENPCTETIEVGEGEVKTAGIDFAPGVYDLRRSGGRGIVEVVIDARDGTNLLDETSYMEHGGTDGEVFYNRVLPAGAQISCDEGISVSLTPSERIASEDYMSFYEGEL